MKFSLPKIVFLVIALALLWILRPFVHPFVIGLVISPLRFVLLCLLVGGIAYVARQIGPLKMVKVSETSYTLKGGRGISGWKLGIYAMVFVLVLIGLFFESELRLARTAKQIDYTTRTELPEFSPIRLTPKDVAERYAVDSFQSPQEHLGDSQIVLVDGHLKRVFPRLPDGGLLYFVRKLSGFVVVDVDTLDRKIAIEDQPFKIAEGIGVFDNLYYRLLTKKYFVNYSHEPIYLKDDAGQWATVVPYITYRGWFFRVPEWGGVVIVQSDGSMTDLSPAEAQTISYLQGNRIFPKELTEYYANSYAYRGGLINKWFLHKNQTEVVYLPNGEVTLHVATKEGYKQMVVVEPYGRSYGIYKIFFFDATTGKPEVIEYDQNSQLTGPIVATDYIKKEFPTYDWSAFSLAEPRPVTINSTLHWLLSIIPNDSAGIASTVLLNAKTNAVLVAKTEPEIQALLHGDTPTAPAPITDKNSQIKAQIEAIEKQLNELKQLISQ